MENRFPYRKSYLCTGTREARSNTSPLLRSEMTEQKALEQQLRQSQKLDGIGQLAGGVAHDFNNLLTVIIGRSQLLEARLPVDSPQHRDAQLIHRTGERAAALTHQLLAFSRNQILQPRVLDLNAVMADMEKMLKRLIREDIELTTVLQKGLARQGRSRPDRTSAGSSDVENRGQTRFFPAHPRLRTARPTLLQDPAEFSFTQTMHILLMLTLLQPDWPYYGGDAGGMRYSAASQINTTNVASLKVAWTYRTGDVSHGADGMRKSKFEATPILFNGTLYFSTPFNRVIALDPATGNKRWEHDPKVDLKTRYSESLVSRGVSAWMDIRAAEGTACKRRVFLGTLDARLIAIDADNGRPCRAFGNDSQIDLSKDAGNVERGQYQVTSPPAVINDLVVVGSAIGDNRQVELERGIVRAFDARTGRMRWSWDPIPRTPESPGYNTWTPDGAAKTGAANAWGAISADAERDLLFIPTGSASPDFYGGERLGSNLYANSVVAMRASTGKIVWHFQVVHHDLWDYDVAAQPMLTIVMRDGRDVPAVVINTKMGHVFVLHRETGAPLFPIEERPVPKSDVPGEVAHPTQPFPVLPPPLHPHAMNTDQLAGDETERKACKEQIEALRYEGIFTPPSLKGTMIYPGYAGGVNWGSAAADPQRALMVTNVNQLPFWVRLIPRDQFAERRIEASRVQLDAEFTPQRGTPYGMSRSLIRSPKGNPCVPQPWGKTVAVDLNTGAIKWETPAATFSLGGAIITGGGLVFVSGALDQKLRALDATSGREVWSASLPAGGQSTPMTYQLSNGKQFVVIAAGGHGDLPVTLGDYVIAYAIP